MGLERKTQNLNFSFLTEAVMPEVKRQSVMHCETRQSEMANTSPRHMPVLGNVHPIKIENFDIFP